MPKALKALKSVLTGKTIEHFAINQLDSKGNIAPVEINVAPVKDGRRIVAVQGSMRNMTERKHMEEILRESEARFRGIAERSFDMIFTMDLEGHITYVSPAVENVTGYRVEEVIGEPFQRYLFKPDLSRAIQIFTGIVKGKTSECLQFQMVKKDGTQFFVEINVSPIVKDGVRIGAQGIIRDITERKLAERAKIEQASALVKAEQLQISRQRIVKAQESLRKELAQQLHGAVQNRLIIFLHRLIDLERESSGKLAVALGELGQDLRDLLESDVRHISRRLYPSILRQGLIPALQYLRDQFESILVVEMKLDEELMRQERNDRALIPEQVRLAVYRITEDALTNIVKHAKASSVAIELKSYPDEWLQLTVRDDGRGFDEGTVPNGLGTVMMQDYAEVVGGTCVSYSARGKGTEITATLPLARPGAGCPEKTLPLE